MSIDLDYQLAIEDGEPGADVLPTVALVEHWVAAALHGRREVAELTVRVVGEPESAELNEAYRKKRGPTNVLSFPFESPPGLDLPLLGDIVACAPVVAREAAEQGKAPEAHWAHMVVHGTLHLLGYDHLEPGEAEVMEKLEMGILADLGYPNPYE